jgi:hypothetical protein
MKVEKSGYEIRKLKEWEKHAGPTRPDQWREGRSAYELAKAWLRTGAPAMPEEFSELLNSSPRTRDMVVDLVHPEARLTFDGCGGNVRNSDIAFVAQCAGGKVAVTVEGKGHESFGFTVAKAYEAAIEVKLKKPRSKAVDRLTGLIPTLFSERKQGQPKVGDLRYQLLTATAGTLAYAMKEGAKLAVMIVHEFKTNLTDDKLHEKNHRDLEAFVRRLSGTKTEILPGTLIGPFEDLPGGNLYPHPVVPLMIGKVVTNCRE